jgi:hypothetical protein
VHFLKDFALVDGVAILGLAIVREMGLESRSEAGVKPVNERLAYADWKGLLVHERVGGSKDLGVPGGTWRFTQPNQDKFISPTVSLWVSKG